MKESPITLGQEKEEGAGGNALAWRNFLPACSPPCLGSGHRAPRGLPSNNQGPFFHLQVLGNANPWDKASLRAPLCAGPPPRYVLLFPFPPGLACLHLPARCIPIVRVWNTTHLFPRSPRVLQPGKIHSCLAPTSSCPPLLQSLLYILVCSPNLGRQEGGAQS